LFDFCAIKLDFSADGKYVRRASRKEEGLMRDRGLGQKEIKELPSKYSVLFGIRVSGSEGEGT
jgi:hypothetical protein